MARLLVIGGTGSAGRHVVREALGRGHDVTVAARRVPDDDNDAYVPEAEYVSLDLVTAAGLEEALDGIDVIVDTTDGVSRASRPVLTTGSLNLLHGAARWGIHRAILLSIVNVERSSFSYYRAKAAQEQIYRDSLLETRIIRTTQFHDFVASLCRSGSRFGIVPTFRRVQFQSIALQDVARLLVDAVDGAGEPDSTATFSGPETLTSKDAAREWKRATASRSVLVPFPLPRGLGRSWRAGLNLAPDQVAGEVGFTAWLSEQASATDRRAAGG